MTSCLCVFLNKSSVELSRSKYCTRQEESHNGQTSTLVYIPLSPSLTTNVLVNIVVRVGVAKARVPGLASQRALLRRQTCRILILKGLPVAGRMGKQDSEKRGPGCFFSKDGHRTIVHFIVSSSVPLQHMHTCMHGWNGLLTSANSSEWVLHSALSLFRLVT